MTDVEWLETLDEGALRTYVRERLQGYASRPAVAWDRGEVPEDYLVYGYEQSQDGLFKETYGLFRFPSLLADNRQTVERPSVVGLYQEGSAQKVCTGLKIGLVANVEVRQDNPAPCVPRIKQ